MEMTAPGVMSTVDLTGAEITIRCLHAEGVEFVFGYPGGAILPIYDEIFKQDKFKHKHDLKIALGSDPAHEMLEAYGAWGEKSLYGRKFMGVIRKTLLIDERGRVARVWPKVSVDGHAKEVLAAAKVL